MITFIIALIFGSSISDLSYILMIAIELIFNFHDKMWN